MLRQIMNFSRCVVHGKAAKQRKKRFSQSWRLEPRHLIHQSYRLCVIFWIQASAFIFFMAVRMYAVRKSSVLGDVLRAGRCVGLASLTLLRFGITWKVSETLLHWLRVGAKPRRGFALVKPYAGFKCQWHSVPETHLNGNQFLRKKPLFKSPSGEPPSTTSIPHTWECCDLRSALFSCAGFRTGLGLWSGVSDTWLTQYRSEHFPLWRITCADIAGVWH